MTARRLAAALIPTLVLVAAMAALPGCDGSNTLDDLVGPTDADGDTIADNVDNCVTAPNPGQIDADGDAVGDSCDCTYVPDACLRESLSRGTCANGIDDDGDGRTDAVDPNCQAENTANANCGDAIDNDGDNVLDCAERDCAGAPGCPGGP